MKNEEKESLRMNTGEAKVQPSLNGFKRINE
jgi:hypothetical protein